MRRGRPRKYGIETNFTDKHLIFELKKSIVLSNHLIEFRNGDKAEVSNDSANYILDTYISLVYPRSKQIFQEFAGQSLENFNKTIAMRNISQKHLEDMEVEMRGSTILDSYWVEEERMV